MMGNDESTLSNTEPTKKGTPWGLFIGLLIILMIIIAGAYYTFTERTAEEYHPTALSNV